jgi:hypothetical protein
LQLRVLTRHKPPYFTAFGIALTTGLQHFSEYLKFRHSIHIAFTLHLHSLLQLPHKDSQSHHLITIFRHIGQGGKPAYISTDFSIKELIFFLDLSIFYHRSTVKFSHQPSLSTNLPPVLNKVHSDHIFYCQSHIHYHPATSIEVKKCLYFQKKS